MLVRGPRDKLVDAVSPKTVNGVKTRVDATFRMWSDINSVFTDRGKKVSLLNDGAVFFKPRDVALLETVSQVHRWTNPAGFLSAFQKAGA